MKQDLILGGALANLHGTAKTVDLLAFLASEVEDLELYRLRPAPGSVKGALDWIAIIGTASSIVTLGGALWAAYQKFVKPVRDSNPQSSAGLFVQVKDKNGSSVQFFLGGEYRDREIFIESFSERVESLRQMVDGDGVLHELHRQIERSGTWVRFK